GGGGAPGVGVPRRLGHHRTRPPRDERSRVLRLAPGEQGRPRAPSPDRDRRPRETRVPELPGDNRPHGHREAAPPRCAALGRSAPLGGERSPELGPAWPQVPSQHPGSHHTSPPNMRILRATSSALAQARATDLPGHPAPAPPPISSDFTTPGPPDGPVKEPTISPRPATGRTS